MASFPSLWMRFVTLILLFKGNDLKAKRFPQWRRKIEGRSYPPPAPMPSSFRTMFYVDEQQLDGRPIYNLTPLHGKQPVHIIYTHGGAYVKPLRPFHWTIIRKLVEQLGASITVPIYPLAPEHTYRETFPKLAMVYRDALRDHTNDAIVLCGDSAGGGLALAQAIWYRDLGLRSPDHVILFSPWLDITMSNPDAAAVEPRDVILGIPGLLQCGLWWAGGEDPGSPLLSPLFGDLSGLPPIEVFQGTASIFVADARKLYEKVSKTSGAIRLFEYPGAFHVFVGATFTPEARDAFDHVTKALGIR